MKQSNSIARTFPPAALVQSPARFFTPGLSVLLAACFSILFMAVPAQAQTSYALSNLFSIPTGTGNLAAGATGNRGMAYDAVSNLLYVASSTATTLGAFSGSNGSYLGALNVTGVSGGTTFSLDQVGVAADGAIYGINLCTSSSSSNKLYRWANWQAAPTVAFNTNALANGASLSYTSGRVGDTLAVTGSGANTLILAGVGAKPYFSLFYTSDGLNFSNTIINVPAGLTVGGNVFGLCFYTNNTFLVKPASSGSSTVYLIQFPTNYASQNVVTGAVMATASLGSSYNNTTMLSYAPGAGLLGVFTTGGNPSPVGLLGAADISGGITALAVTNAVDTYNGGNATGAAALGGNGLTNALYVYNTGDALYAYQIAVVPPQAPSIAVQPVGGTVYPPYTLTVSAIGTAPLSYEWQATNSAAAGSFTNILGATTNSYTVASVSTNYYRVIVANSAGSVTSSVVQVTALSALTNSAVTPLWAVAAGQAGYSWLSTSDGYERGLAYDTNSQTVVVSATSGLYLLNGNTGASNGVLNLTGTTFGGLLPGLGIDQVGVADDGAVYAGNLINNGGNFVLYRWSAPTNTVTATAAFAADPASGTSMGDRWGDTLATRGAGTNTQILIASQSGTNIALLTTMDGSTFTSSLIAVTGVPAGFASGGGLAFGAGNTLWAKVAGGDLWEVAFNPTNLTGSVVFDYPQPSKISSAIAGVGIDPVNNIFSGVSLGDVPHDLQLFQLTGTADAPTLFDQSFFASANSNPNASVAIAVKYPRMYALDANNGIVAVTYGVPAASLPVILTPPAGTTAYANAGNVTFSVAASGSAPLYYQWRFNSNNIAGATSSVYTITNSPSSAAGYYDVVVSNIAGAVTSAPPALLTLIAPTTSPTVTHLWSLAPGSIPAISDFDGSSYNVRGLAYDTNTATVLLADHNTIYLLAATNGGYLGALNMLGVPNSGLNGWLVDQIGVADDGVLYSCNLTATGPGFAIVQWASITPNAVGTGYAYGGSSGADPGNGSGDRWGDTMSVRGSGVNTEILVGSYSGTNVVLFTTTDGANFTPTLIAITNVPAAFAGLGIAFGEGNTFWADGGGDYNLRQVAFDPIGAVGGAIESFNAGTQAPYNLTGLSVDVTNNILGSVEFGDVPNDMQLYLLSGNSNAPDLFNQTFFSVNNVNGQQNAVTVLKGGLGFGLDVNNGLVAVSYSRPSAPPVTLTGVTYAPGDVTINWDNIFSGYSYQLQYKNTLLDPAWIDLGSPVSTTNATVSYPDTTASGNTRFYRVISP